MTNTLLEKCNADVFRVILEIKTKNQFLGEKLIDILQKHEYWWQMTGFDMLYFSAHLPLELWNCKVHTFSLLFESQQTTVMP